MSSIIHLKGKSGGLKLLCPSYREGEKTENRITDANIGFTLKAVKTEGKVFRKKKEINFLTQFTSHPKLVGGSQDDGSTLHLFPTDVCARDASSSRSIKQPRKSIYFRGKRYEMNHRLTEWGL